MHFVDHRAHFLENVHTPAMFIPWREMKHNAREHMA